MILTLFPPTFTRESGQAGTNGPFYAIYNRNHRYAAAIAAQEVREARFNLPFYALAMLIGGVTAHLLLPPMGEARIVAIAIAAAIALLPVGLFPPRKRRTELLGQSVECVVRRDRYGTALGTALDEAARQLTGYGQFNGYGVERIRRLLEREIPGAEEWAAANRKLIDKAFEGERK